MNNYKVRSTHILLQGEDGHLCPNADASLLRSGIFKALGKMMVHSLIHTGVAAYGLGRAVVRFIITGKIETIDPRDIPDLEARNALTIVSCKINFICKCKRSSFNL